MKKLLILFLAIAAVGCKEGGILNDNDVVLPDSLASPVKKVSVNFESNMPMYITDDGGLILVENYVSSTEDSKDYSAKRIAKISPDGFKSFMQMPTPNWLNYNNVPQEAFEKFAPKIHTISNVFKGSDGCFYSLGIEQPRFQEDLVALSVTKFDSDLKIIYDYCAIFLHEEGSPTPYIGVPLDNGRFVILSKIEDFFQSSFECFAMIIGADGNVESEFQFDPEFTEVSGGEVYSCGDIIIYDYTDWDNVEHIRSFSSKGEFMYEQIANGRCVKVSYTGKNTILTCFEEGEPQCYEDENGYPVTIRTGKYYYTDITPDLTSTEVRDFNGTDSSYVVLGGVYYGASQILYGYCRESFKPSYSVDYHFNENDSKGFILQDGKLYTIAGTSSKAILGVWYSGGTYTVYYDERLPEAEWSHFVTIIKTNDLKKLEN